MHVALNLHVVLLKYAVKYIVTQRSARARAGPANERKFFQRAGPANERYFFHCAGPANEKCFPTGQAGQREMSFQRPGRAIKKRRRIILRISLG